MRAHRNEVSESLRERDHDDLVLALTLAVWAGKRTNLRICSGRRLDSAAAGRSGWRWGRPGWCWCGGRRWPTPSRSAADPGGVGVPAHPPGAGPGHARGWMLVDQWREFPFGSHNAADAAGTAIRQLEMLANPR